MGGGVDEALVLAGLVSAEESSGEAARDASSLAVSSAKSCADGGRSGQSDGASLVGQVDLGGRLDARLLGHLSSLALLSPSPATLQVCLLTSARALQALPLPVAVRSGGRAT